ncbi:hypothetical protein K438DRAFT_1911284 [Mycena galopus ATCC 62051]|nr:hypothetical protein K438DRAFT_1911284 [Mycena galopus ATCC 62051]
MLNNIVLAGLLAQKPFKHIAGFLPVLLKCFAPILHTYYAATMDKLHGWNPQLGRLFPPKLSVFTAVTFNFGPQTVTWPHLDFNNLAWGWCTITALSNFDPDKGGHLILWDLKLIIHFLPGCTILIPSALLRHSNTSIQALEKIFSFTPYTTAGIFREVKVNAGGLTEAQKAARLKARKRHWVEGLDIYQRWCER